MMNGEILDLVEMVVLTMGMGVSSITDLRTKKVSTKVIGILLLMGCVFQVMERYLAVGNLGQGNMDQGNLWEWGFFLRFLPGLLCIVISLISRGNVGMGDGLMIFMLGAFLKTEEIISTCFVALTMVGLVALVAMVLLRKKRDVEIPFVPFLFAGFLVTKLVCGGC